MLPLERPRRIGLIGTGSVGSGWAAIYPDAAGAPKLTPPAER